MTADIYWRSVLAQKAGFAAELGCDPAHFERDGVTVVVRPEPQVEPFVALAVWFGTGRVLSVHPLLLEWAREAAPAEEQLQPWDPDRAVLNGEFLFRLAARAAELGVPAIFRGSGVNWALTALPAGPSLPPGWGYRELTPEERSDPVLVRTFGNALDNAGPVVHTLAATGHGGAVEAVAGVFDRGLERFEVGIDVVPGARQHGLARALVLEATGWIIRQGQTPLYSCGATNLRSQRLALACGYVPVAVMSAVVPAGASPTS